MQDELLEKVVKKVMQQLAGQECSRHQAGVFDNVNAAILAAKKAQSQYDAETLASRRKVIQAIRTQMSPLLREIAERTLAETGMGRVEDKLAKLELVIEKTPGVEDLRTVAETGDNGMTLYERSAYGVVGAVTPSTNPAETLICNTIGMLAAGNAVYFSVHPGAKEISKWVVSKLNDIIYQACTIQNLVVTIEEPTIEAAQEMMQHPDIALLVVTGGPAVVHQAMISGKKTIGAGAGNPPVIVDETANIEKAARDIVLGASFDNNILCIAEKSVVVVKDVTDYLMHQMAKYGAYILSDPEKIEQLVKVTISETGAPSRKFIGKNASVLLEAIGIKPDYDVRLIILKATLEHPFVMKEMLMPILPIVSVTHFDDALKAALVIENHLHHTAMMHSQNIGRLNQAGRKLQTSIFVKNGSSFAGLGFGGEGMTTFTIATPTGEGTTSAKDFTRCRRCVLTDGFSIR
jgi:propionaldehyde dehydrogenase